MLSFGIILGIKNLKYVTLLQVNRHFNCLYMKLRKNLQFIICENWCNWNSRKNILREKNVADDGQWRVFGWAKTTVTNNLLRTNWLKYFHLVLRYFQSRCVIFHQATRTCQLSEWWKIESMALNHPWIHAEAWGYERRITCRKTEKTHRITFFRWYLLHHGWRTRTQGHNQVGSAIEWPKGNNDQKAKPTTNSYY